MSIAEGSSKAGFVYGANDIRLMDKYKNIYQLENNRNESYLKIELDITELEQNSKGVAKLNVYVITSYSIHYTKLYDTPN